MKIVQLNRSVRSGESLQASFFPECGMNLASLKKGDLEVIDPSTRALFEERFAGLGALIGPHFHRRSPASLPLISHEERFPHIARIKALGIADPFSHGIARYAPWTYDATSTGIRASLSGKDCWNEIPLAALEGQQFQMKFSAELTGTGLDIAFSVVSEADSLVGIHYYYRLPEGRGRVVSRVQSTYVDNQQRIPIPSSWNYGPQNHLQMEIGDTPIDYTFFPFPDPLQGEMILHTSEYSLKTTYWSQTEENSWQLYHPAGASFVCIEPLSAQDPRHPNLTVSSLRIRLEILEPVFTH